MNAEQGTARLSRMIRLLPWLVGLIVVFTAPPASAEKRVALIIGNGAYQNVTPLKNPVNDAQLMERTLQGIGFDVISAYDTTQKDIRRAVKKFGERLKDAGSDAVGLFYYAGHGLQVGGLNYLVPVDAEIADEGDVEIEAVNANAILSRMEHSGARLNFVILDACRDNPYSDGFRSTASRGLARMDAPTGSLVAYATGPGDVAADGTGRNSPYTAALARMMKKPGLSVERMFREVRNRVRDRTNDTQTPWESSSLVGGDFYFAGKGDGTGGTATAALSSDDPKPRSVEPSAIDSDALFWQSVEAAPSRALYEAYLKNFPEGKFAVIASARLAALSAPRNAPASGTTAQSGNTQLAVGSFNATPIPQPGTLFQDCASCPKMIVVPGGTFRMGSDLGFPSEMPVRQVTIPDGLALGIYEVTLREYRRFIEYTGHSSIGSCHTYENAAWQLRADRNWEYPGYKQTDRDPVTCVTWEDAKAYADWLSQITGTTYRLPSESEWEFVARAGTQTKYSWGDTASHSKANYGAETCCGPSTEGRDQWAHTAPVGSFDANAFGLYDIHGNVLEWVEDCWVEGYARAPADNRPTLSGECSKRVERGGSWNSTPQSIRSARRNRGTPDTRYATVGFRVLKELRR